MAYRYTSLAPRMQVKLTTEKVKVLRVIGEQVGQLVVESELPLAALDIDHIQVELCQITNRQFAGKVVQHGIAQQQIYYMDPEHALRCAVEETPYMLTLNIPGLAPNCFTEAQHHLMDITPEYKLAPASETDTTAVVHLKICAHILVAVSEWTQLDVVTRVDVFPRHN